MSQDSYSLDQAAYFAGMKADSRFDEVESFAAEEAIPFGRGVAMEAGTVGRVRLPRKDNAKLVFDADFVTSNKINGKVDGVAFAEVDFDTDHDTTADALVAAIAALSGVTCILDSTDTNNRTFLIENEDGSAVTISDVAVTGGASQAGSTVTYSADDLFRGIALSTQKEQSIAGVAQYDQYEAVSVLRKGQAVVETAVAVTADDDAYVLADGTGKFTNSSTGAISTGGKFRSTIASAGLAKVDINLP